MYKKTTRTVTWLILIAIFVSMLSLPVMAAAEDGEGAAEESAVTEGPAMPVEDEEVPVVNVIGDEPADEPGAEEPSAEEEPAPEAEPASEEEPAPEEPSEETSEEAAPETEDEASEEMEIDGAGEKFTVSYYSGTTLLATEEVVSGEKPVKAPEADGSGKPIRAWLDKSGKRVVLEETAITAAVSYYAWFAPQLNSAAHNSYINGVGSAKFSPTGALTRAQAATILYKLLEDQKTGPFSTAFSDVSDSSWYATAVKTLASIGVINGYKDGTFRPSRNVTRAEFVTMLVNLTGATGSDISFSDVSATNWARNAISAAASNGWVNGYTDGTFRPGNNITRAEAVVIMNRVLGRSADKYTVDNSDGILHFIDVSTSAWYYYDVMEASTGHEYTRSGSSETWTGFNMEKSDLAPGLHKIDSTYVYVDSHQQPVRMKEGINGVDGKFFYAPSAGYTFTGDLSTKKGYVVFSNGAASQALKDGFNTIGNTLFYWSLSSASAMFLNATLNKIGDKSYWANEDGYNICNSFVDVNDQPKSTKGVVKLDGKCYLMDGYCAIITTGLAYKYANEKPVSLDLKKRNFEYEGALYYVKDDYSLARDEWVGYLYFGTACKYTSGDATLDAYVENIVKDFVGNNVLTWRQKLLKAYYYMRGGSGKYYDTTVDGVYYGKSPFSYTRVNMIYMKQKRFTRQGHIYDFIDCAKQMFSLKRGMCYQWAAAYLYLARRLGFQAYPVVGKMNGALHCWDLIKWSGEWHLSDVEFEWGYLSGWYGGNYRVYRNLFDQTLSSQWVSTYKNEDAGLSYTFPSAYE